MKLRSVSRSAPSCRLGSLCHIINETLESFRLPERVGPTREVRPRLSWRKISKKPNSNSLIREPTQHGAEGALPTMEDRRGILIEPAPGKTTATVTGPNAYLGRPTYATMLITTKRCRACLLWTLRRGDTARPRISPVHDPPYFRGNAKNPGSLGCSLGSLFGLDDGKAHFRTSEASEARR